VTPLHYPALRPVLIYPNPPDVPSDLTPTELIQFAAHLAEREHSQLRVSWQNLDVKAQATAGIAGAMLMILFAFVRDTSAHTLSGFAFALLLATLLALVAASALALCSMRLRAFPVPPESAFKISEVNAILSAPPSEFSGRTLAALKSGLSPWQEVNEKAQANLAAKAAWLNAAQLGLLLSMLSTAALIAKLALG
jgi:hypothetical protein